MKYHQVGRLGGLSLSLEAFQGPPWHASVEIMHLSCYTKLSTLQLAKKDIMTVVGYLFFLNDEEKQIPGDVTTSSRQTNNEMTKKGVILRAHGRTREHG